jgi:hypothetical protein
LEQQLNGRINLVYPAILLINRLIFPSINLHALYPGNYNSREAYLSGFRAPSILLANIVMLVIVPIFSRNNKI